MIETGVIHGRFQVVHNDHLKYLLAGKKVCNHLVVGITNPDPMLTRNDDSDPRRSRPESNPLTYFERMIMIRDVFFETGVKDASFSIVPFPINFPELYDYYVPMDATFFLTIYDAWGRKKLNQFKGRGLKTHILWDRKPQDKGISAGDVRECMRKGYPWEHMVPLATKKLMEKWGIPERVRSLYEQRP